MRWKALSLGVAAMATAIMVSAEPEGGSEASVPGVRSSHPRPETIAALDRAAQNRADSLRVSLLGGSEGDVRVGDEIAFEFESERDAHVTCVHVDGEGNLLVLAPRSVEANRPLRFPAEESIGVVLPIGLESVYAFATAQPLTLEQLGVPASEGRDFASVDPVVGPDFAACLHEHLERSARRGEAPAAAVLQYRVRPDGSKLPYTEETVEDYFATVTRSYERPTLDLLIHFEHDSTELGEEARARLDEVGKALSGSRIGAYRFRLNGHTDDVGASDYNLSLSQRRADAAMQYLVSEYGVDPENLEPVGWGEASPKVTGTDREARETNRRVELELVGSGMRSIYRCGP